MLRIDLPEPLASGVQFEFAIAWSFAINDARINGGRTGFERLTADGTRLYTIAQWYPRLCAYTDVRGWQHKAFLGRGEFTLEFGDYLVEIHVPADHVVAATGELRNANEVLSETMRVRLDQARTAPRPQWVITPEEAEATAKQPPAQGMRTWIFAAHNVRDFAWASCRRFIWDAWGVAIGDRRVLAMSFYPREGEPLWSRYSTQAVAQALEVYSEHLVPYPYPVAISVNGPVGGMEYPMICFNGPRPESDGSYHARTKFALISVIIHEVGHNWFPMVINSDERQWTWLDEGLNSFVQYLAEKRWQRDYPSRAGVVRGIREHMRRHDQMPIMTNSESLIHFGANAYAKPAAALDILRETVLGRERFDFALKTYARRWAFKRPEPADFFRTIEDASGTDLDWFWRGWFYTTDHVDIGIVRVRYQRAESLDPAVFRPQRKAARDAGAVTIGKDRDAVLPVRHERHPDLADFYDRHDADAVTTKDREAYQKLLEGLSEEEKALLALERCYYVIELENVGGLVMPVILELTYEAGGSEMLRLPVEIWRLDTKRIARLIVTERPVASFRLDPLGETADVEEENDHFPRRLVLSRFELFKQGKDAGDNPLREALKQQQQQLEPGAQNPPR
jgi:hypothetical protein